MSGESIMNKKNKILLELDNFNQILNGSILISKGIVTSLLHHKTGVDIFFCDFNKEYSPQAIAELLNLRDVDDLCQIIRFEFNPFDVKKDCQYVYDFVTSRVRAYSELNNNGKLLPFDDGSSISSNDGIVKSFVSRYFKNQKPPYSKKVFEICMIRLRQDLRLDRSETTFSSPDFIDYGYYGSGIKSKTGFEVSLSDCWISPEYYSAKLVSWKLLDSSCGRELRVTAEAFIQNSNYAYTMRNILDGAIANVDEFLLDALSEQANGVDFYKSKKLNRLFVKSLMARYYNTKDDLRSDASNALIVSGLLKIMHELGFGKQIILDILTSTSGEYESLKDAIHTHLSEIEFGNGNDIRSEFMKLDDENIVSTLGCTISDFLFPIDDGNAVSKNTNIIIETSLYDGIQIFNQKQLSSVVLLGDQSGFDPLIKKALKNGGKRDIPSFDVAFDAFEKDAERYENFDEVMSFIKDEISLASILSADEFKIRPILMNGPPGVGKTEFSIHLAQTLGVSFKKVSAGSTQTGAIFCGTDAHWANARPGMVFSLLSESGCATGVLIIDEVDKIPTDPHHPILPSLLDLLEPSSSKIYRDECLKIEFDASHLIVLMTSNSVNDVDEALLSRCHVFNIQPPSRNQKIAIIKSEFDRLNRSITSGASFNLNQDSLSEFIGGSGDIRALITSLRRSFVSAVKKSSSVVTLEFKSSSDGNSSKPKIGF